MVHRTHLTTPPGEAPVLAADATSELYTPGLAVPREPKVPLKHRGKLIGLTVVVSLLVLAYVAFQVVTSGQDFDPSLDVPPGQEFDPTIGMPRR